MKIVQSVASQKPLMSGMQKPLKSKEEFAQKDAGGKLMAKNSSSPSSPQNH